VDVHLRRAILLFALVLGLTALAAAVSPTRNEDPPASAPVLGVPSSAVLPRALAFDARDPGAPEIRRARTGEHLMLTVVAPEGGLVTIPRLGRTASVSPSAAARFDVLAPQPGRYDVLLQQPSGPDEPRRVGTLVTRP
jgi:hypothetical protein